MELLEGSQGASVQCKLLNLDFTPGEAYRTSAEWGFCGSWVQLQKNKILLLAPLSLG